LETLPSDFDKHVSITLDSEAIINELIGKEFVVVLHGHQHKPFFANEKRFNNKLNKVSRVNLNSLYIIGAGSVSVKSKHLGTFGRNHYNIVKITDNCIEVNSREARGSDNGFKCHYRLEEWR